jgi:hypothetical protein
VTTSNRRSSQVGLPHFQLTTEGTAGPWGRPEMF